MRIQDFQHRHAGHCESGVMSSLLSHYGLPISEPMAFGLSSALTFAHMPFIKIGGIPLTAYRMMPGHVIRGLEKTLGIKMERRRYRSAQAGAQDLDSLLQQGQLVGLQTSVYWLPYFPPDMRFHFNAHNLIVFGKEDGHYLISDPVFEDTQVCAEQDLLKARFVKGPFAPKGFTYFPARMIDTIDYNKAVRKAIKKTANMMVRTPVPIVGVSAIRTMAKTIRKLPLKHKDHRYARLFISSIIRMQEEIGTGGAGFRFMYASFLQEAGAKLQDEKLDTAASDMTAAGDLWREFALAGAQFCKNKQGGDYAALSEHLLACAAAEEIIYKTLLKK